MTVSADFVAAACLSHLEQHTAHCPLGFFAFRLQNDEMEMVGVHNQWGGQYWRQLSCFLCLPLPVHSGVDEHFFLGYQRKCTLPERDQEILELVRRIRRFLGTDHLGLLPLVDLGDAMHSGHALMTDTSFSLLTPCESGRL